MLQQIQNRRIYTQVAAQIESLIRNNTYPEGSFLPTERELAQQLRVSRSSVREGLIALEVMGYVEVRVGSGIVVLGEAGRAASGAGRYSHRSGAEVPDDLPIVLDIEAEIPPFDLLRARLLIEPECAALAAENATDEQIAGIVEAYHHIRADNEAKSTTHPGDRLFHIRISEASGNAAYAAMISHLLSRYGSLFQRLQRLYTPHDMPRRSETEHLEILTAIEQRKAISARNAMQAHLQAVIAIFSRDVE